MQNSILGWFDHVTENHHTVSVETYSQVYEAIVSYPASVNIYMFVGSTNFGFTNGASSLYSGLDNSGLQPDITRQVHTIKYKIVFTNQI